MADSEDVSPLPQGADTLLREARASAVALLLEAEDAEAEARDMRRRARSSMKHYERLLQEHLGQLSILDEGVQ